MAILTRVSRFNFTNLPLSGILTRVSRSISAIPPLMANLTRVSRFISALPYEVELLILTVKKHPAASFSDAVGILLCYTLFSYML